MKTKRYAGVEYVRGLLRIGSYAFSRNAAAQALGRSGPGLSNTLKRLEKSGWIMPVSRGFYAVIDSGNQAFGFAPPHSFLDAWAKQRGFQYYMSGISAAELHGAAHQRTQVYQVVTDRTLPTFDYNGLHISFFRKKPITDRMWTLRNVFSGYLRVSTPETTAYDLLFLPRACRSLSRVATIFIELGEVLKPAELATLCGMGCETVPLQRLGWLLDHTGWGKHTGQLHKKLQIRGLQWRLLEPRLPMKGQRNNRWHIIENTDIQPDI